MPHLSEILKAELAKLRERAEKASLDIIETGTIRNTGENYRVNDGWSTLTLAEDAVKHDGAVTSIDLDISSAEAVLTQAGRKVRNRVTLAEGHSIDRLSDYLSAQFVYDVAFLDSDNDAALILHEYLIVRRMVRSPGLIMVDDVDMSSAEVMKGHQIVKWLDAEGTPYRLEKRHGDGYETGVLVIEV